MIHGDKCRAGSHSCEINYDFSPYAVPDWKISLSLTLAFLPALTPALSLPNFLEQTRQQRQNLPEKEAHVSSGHPNLNFVLLSVSSTCPMSVSLSVLVLTQLEFLHENRATKRKLLLKMLNFRFVNIKYWKMQMGQQRQRPEMPKTAPHYCWTIL